MIREIIIIGGGSSIKEGLSLCLKEKLEGKCVFTINYAYKHFPHTCLLFGDKDFYVKTKNKDNPRTRPDIYEELAKEPLIFYTEINNGLKKFIMPNTYGLLNGEIYNTNPLKLGFYKHFLTGIWAISLAQFIMDYKGTIYLLGYDWTKKPKGKEKTETHYYTKEEINHNGIGKYQVYTSHNPSNYFDKFKEPNIKIYNVSPNSNIKEFEKIDYPTMFNKLGCGVFNQENLRQEIKAKLKLK